MRRHLGYLATLALCVFGAQPSAGQTSSDTPPDHSPAQEFRNPRIAKIDQQIMLECVELARFNALFHRSLNRKTFYQQWLYPMQREAGTALSFSNTVIDLVQRSRGLNNLSSIDRPAQKRGVECALVGQAITGSASAFSLGTNLTQLLIARRHGYSPGDSLATVKRFADRIDVLLAERDKLIADENVYDRNDVYAVQRRMLDHLRNQLVYEYKTWSISSRQVEWQEDTFYAIDSIQGFTQLASSCLSLNAFQNSRLSGPAAITNLTAGVLVTVNPIVRTLAGRYIAHRQRRHLDAVFPKARPKELEEVLSEWGKTADIGKRENATGKTTEELGFMVRRSGELDLQLDRETRRLEQLRRIADQQAISGPLIGLTSVARGILNTDASYQGSSDSAKTTANALNFSGRIVQGTGQIYSLIVTPTTEVRHYFYLRNLRRAGKAPEQILQARLEKLDELDKRIRSFNY